MWHAQDNGKFNLPILDLWDGRLDDVDTIMEDNKQIANVLLRSNCMCAVCVCMCVCVCV